MKWTTLAAIAVVFTITSTAVAAWPSIFDDRAGSPMMADSMTSDGVYVPAASYHSYQRMSNNCCDNVWAGYCSEPGHCGVSRHAACDCGCDHGHGLLAGLLGSHHTCGASCGCVASGCTSCGAGAGETIIIESESSEPAAMPSPPQPTPASFDRTTDAPSPLRLPQSFQILRVGYTR